MTYPVIIDFTVGGTTDGADHNAVNDQIIIASGKQGNLSIAITDDGAGDPDETLIITLANPVNAALTDDTSVTLTVVEENIAPIADFRVIQDTKPTLLIDKAKGSVTINGIVIDPNANETHSYDWTLTDNNLVDVDDADATTYVFDPSNLVPGLYGVTLTITDGGGLSSKISKKVRVLAIAIPLTTADSDGDGISDIDEGAGDNDGDGIPDYLDDEKQPGNVLPLPNGKTIEVAEGLKVKIGKNAFGGSRGTASTTVEDIASYGDAAGGVSTTDNGFEIMSKIFDFAIDGLSKPGEKASIVIPLEIPLPANAVYRKFLPDRGWVTLTTGADYNIESALSESVNGVCPQVNSTSYTSGLTQGDDCIRLTLVDGGAFDGDGVTNGVIEDPGVIATEVAIVIDPIETPIPVNPIAPVDPVTDPISSVETPVDSGSTSGGGGGGSISLWMLLMLIMTGFWMNQRVRGARLKSYMCDYKRSK